MNIDMTRHQGDNGLPLIECTNTRLQKYRVRADFQPYENERDGKKTQGVSFVETEFDYKPTMQEVKEFVIGVINAQTDEKILCGYAWKVLHGSDEGKVVQVWLSDENQRNYKAYHDAALAYPEQVTFPQVYKLGEDEDGKAIYEEFQNISELAAFYLGGIGFIDKTLKEGYELKDGFDWSEYERQLSES